MISLRAGNYLICFTGVDGSGKTTHAKSLVKFLSNKGFRCSYVWGASRPVLAYAFFGVTRMLGYWIKTKRNAYTDPLELAPRKVANRLGSVWQGLLFMDFQLKTLFKIRLPLVLGRTVVCDRYFYDMLMELQLSGLSSDKYAKLLSETLPQPLVTFMPDASENVTAQRRGLSPEELRAKRRAFLRIAERFDCIAIDSSKDFVTNQDRIRTETLKRIAHEERNT